jgi:UDP-N-acetylmuramoyl-tripeptide--D-alanyl-D-alanine ligase
LATPIPVNRCSFGTDEIVSATGAIMRNSAALRVTGVSIDSRTIAPGALFVALRGIRDGHDFLASAAERGAAAAIIERGRSHPGLPCFEVEDTLVALGALARLHLERMRAARPFTTITIGGAAGKTTTKELTAALARALFGEILVTPGNLNNLIGVPMTILTLDSSAHAAVLECATNQRGEIARLGAIVRPDVSLVLNVDIEHTEGLGSLEGVADEEASIFGAARVAVTAADEPMLLARIPNRMRTVTFSASAPADVSVARRTVVAPGRQRVALALARDLVDDGAEPVLDYTISLLGAVCAGNTAAAVAAAATAIARPLGRDQLAAMACALATVQPVEGRLATRQIAGVVVIDDTYNANPRSVRAALDAARETADGLRARLIVALGDMLELGSLASEMHIKVVREVLRARPDALIAVGREMAAGVAAVCGGGDPSPPALELASDSTAAAAIVRAVVRPGDVLLVKGSRGIAMERVIEALVRAPQ